MLGSKDEKIHDLFRHKVETFLRHRISGSDLSSEWSEYLESFGCARIVEEWARPDLDFMVIYDPYDEVARRSFKAIFMATQVCLDSGSR
jgi:hypothetical protein